MPTHQTLVTFALVCAGVMLLPGPSNFFLLAHGIGHGRRAALAAMTGIEIASSIRVLLTAAGLSAILASSPLALGVVHWAGVAYLGYLGFRSFHQAVVDEPAPDAGRPASLYSSVRKGLVVGLANPKMMIFFLSFFPQFIDPERGSPTTQILILGAIFWVVGAAWDLALAYLAGAIGSWIHRRPHLQTAQPRVEGFAYVGLAGWAAIAGS